MTDPRPFHRLFALSWADFFDGTTVDVETELDLSLKQQFIDVVLIRKGPGPIPRRMPDGFEDLAAHNLITFKSHQEALDAWSLAELVGHYVNYRKQASPSMQDLLPEADFRLFAVCARFPQGLAKRIELQRIEEGVYDAVGFGLRVRIVVLGQLPQECHNAMLHLFAAREDLLQFGRLNYKPRSPETSSLLFRLFETYEGEMATNEKLREFARQTIKEMLGKLTPAERLEGLPPEDRLRGLSQEELLRMFNALPASTRETLIRDLRSSGEAQPPE